MTKGWRDLRGARIFFPLAIGFSALWMPIWLLRYTGALPPSAALPGATWHGHEMIYGYLAAMVAGFLTVGDRGPRVLALAALWILARLLFLVDAPLALSAAVDMAFLPLLVLLRKPPLWTGAKFMSLGIAAVAATLSVTNLWILVDDDGGATALRTAAILVAALIIVVAGRLVPGHTRAATRRGPGLALTRAEQGSVGLVVALIIGAAADMALLAGAAAGALGLVQGYRLWRWSDRDVVRDPLLWGLHVGFGWLVLGLLTLAAARFELGPTVTDALHFMLVGAVGNLTLVIAMRLMRAQAGESQKGGRGEAAVLLLVSTAAILRAVVPILVPDWRLPATILGGGAWSLAALLALIFYAPRVVAPKRGSQRE